MADLKLVNVRKVYPWGSSAEKKKALAASDNPEYTEEGVVAVHDFTLDIADKEFVVLVVINLFPSSATAKRSN